MTRIRTLYLHKGHVPHGQRGPSGVHSVAVWLCRGCAKIAGQLGWLSLALAHMDRFGAEAGRREGIVPPTGPIACHACGATLGPDYDWSKED